MKRFRIVILIVIFLLKVSLNADNKTDSQNKYNSGMEKFQNGDIDGAIIDLREAITLDERNFKAKKSLVDVLLIKGKNLINEEKYDEATEILKEAYRHFPSNQEVADLYKGLKDGSVQEAKKKEKELAEKEKLSTTENSKKEDNKTTKENETSTKIKKEANDNTISKNQLAEIEKKYALELERQRKMYEKIIESYKGGGNIQLDPNFIKKQSEIFDSFITKYNELLKQNEEERKKNMEILVKQMEENRRIIEKQGGFSNNIIITIIISFLLAVVLFIVSFYILFFIARKRKFAASFTNETINELSNTLYLENDSKKNQLVYDEIENKDISLIESEMLKDLLKSEKLKKMHLEMKQGKLSWDTVKEYIGEMNKELRVEILKLVETKLLNEEINNEAIVLPILLPFLTDGDDYIREKAKSLIKTNIKRIGSVNSENDIVINEISNSGTLNIQELSLKSQEIDKLLFRVNHSYNTARYSKGIANILGLSKDKQYLIYETALIHDIGYNFIGKDVLYNIKNKKDLSENDFTEIRKHPLKGKEFLEKFEDIQKDMLDGILYHHERNDGSGYPYGLKNDQIPLFAKILGVSDTFDALTSKRFHKENLSFKSALIIIKDMGKNKFNTEIINALEEYLTKTNLINVG